MRILKGSKKTRKVEEEKNIARICLESNRKAAAEHGTRGNVQKKPHEIEEKFFMYSCARTRIFVWIAFFFSLHLDEMSVDDSSLVYVLLNQ